MATEEQVRATLRAVWHVTAIDCVADADAPGFVPGSRWSVMIDDAPHEVRVVPESQRLALLASLAAVEALSVAGIAIGRPVRTADGALTATTSIGEMALSRDVPGRPLDPGDPIDQQFWGDLLGRAHVALRHYRPPWHERLTVPVVAGSHLDVADWLRPALRDVVLAVTRLTVTDQLTYGVLHGDPAPAEFRLDPATGSIGLTGWASPLHGPLTYDVAVAVRHAGGIGASEDLLDGYASAGPAPRDELAAALPTMLRLHWALVADAQARALAGSVVPLPRAAALAAAGRRDVLEQARQVLAELAEADRAD